MFIHLYAAVNRGPHLNADKVQSRHRSEKLVVVEPPGQPNVEVLEHLDIAASAPSSTHEKIDGVVCTDIFVGDV